MFSVVSSNYRSNRSSNKRTSRARLPIEIVAIFHWTVFPRDRSFAGRLRIVESNESWKEKTTIINENRVTKRVAGDGRRSVGRSSRMIGCNQFWSGRLCRSLAFQGAINRLRPSTSSLATRGRPRIPIFSAVRCKATRVRNVWRGKEPQTSAKWITSGQRRTARRPNLFRLSATALKRV